MRANDFIVELQLPKNSWTSVLTTADKEEVGDELIDLVRFAYANTADGSFINSMRDVLPSDWVVIDWDDDPDVDAAIFYRKSRPNESWAGSKIQGVGHDGVAASKQHAVSQLLKLLQKPGWWIESSDAMRSVLKKFNVPAVTDIKLLQRLFNDPNLSMMTPDTYTRTLPSGRRITETVFGNPVLK